MNLLSPSQRPTNMSPKFNPNDHIPNLLSLLPVKSLLRFRCLSKPHDSLISDPTFIKWHLTRSAWNADFTLVSTSDRNVVFFTVFRLLQNPPIIPIFQKILTINLRTRTVIMLLVHAMDYSACSVNFSTPILIV